MSDRTNDIIGSRLEANEVLSQLDALQERLEGYEKMFPLHTQATLAKRWGVSRSVVANWQKRHSDFCEPVNENLIASDVLHYPISEVLRYEKVRGLK